MPRRLTDANLRVLMAAKLGHVQHFRAQARGTWWHGWRLDGKDVTHHVSKLLEMKVLRMRSFKDKQPVPPYLE